MTDFIKLYRDEKVLDKSPTTVKYYTYQLRAFEKWLNKPVEQAERSDTVRYLAYLLQERGLKKSSASIILIVIKTFYKWMVELEYIKASPAASVKLPKPDKRVVIYLETHELLDFMKVVQHDERDKWVVRMLYSTGERVSELVRMRMKDIDWKTGKIKVFGKGSKERIVSIHPQYIDEFKAYAETVTADKKKNPDGRIFPVSTRTVQADINTITKRAGIDKHITPHKLRHTFATQLYAKTHDVLAIKALLGHERLETTEIYTHQNQDEVLKKQQMIPVLDVTQKE